MRTIPEIQQEIRRRKAETAVCILAHSYQSPDILEIADITGDSYKLSAAAGKTDKKTAGLRRAVHGRDRKAPESGETGL